MSTNTTIQKINVPVTSPFPSSPAGPSFIPRKEFAPQPNREYSSFALLAFSSNNAIRLSNFPQHLVTELRARLRAIIGLRSFRENTEHKLCEIILVGKPWSSPKALSTEVVLVQVFSILFYYGFSFICHMDYGREHNDRVFLAFSRPVTSSNLDGPISAQLDLPHQVPFALSFSSSNTLKVVCSPLYATPAILQSIRSAWPRGVSSEKKLGENCYEFKLKGYSWFQEDTFADDALSHILTILTSLDKHSWKLVTSISLCSRHARNKDLWIFSGPHSTQPTDLPVRPSSPIKLGSPLKPTIYEPIVDDHKEGSGDLEVSHPGMNSHGQNHQHVRSATENTVSVPGRLNKSHNGKDGHQKSLSEDIAVLTKKTPPNARPMLPLSSEESTLSDHLPVIAPTMRPETSIRRAPSHSLISLPEPVERTNIEEEAPSGVGVGDDQTLRGVPVGDLGSVAQLTPPLLAPTTFRPLYGSDSYTNSTFSDVTGQSFDVPITWIPRREYGDITGDRHTDNVLRRAPPSAFPEEVQDNRTSVFTVATETTGPLLPGSWMSTPSLDTNDQNLENSTFENTMPHQDTPVYNEPRHNAVVSHSPQIMQPELAYRDGCSNRKSEKGMMGTIDPAHDAKAANKAVGGVSGREANSSVDGNKPESEGWVLVSFLSQLGSPEIPSTPQLLTTATATAAGDKDALSPPHVPLTAVKTITASDAIVREPPIPNANSEKNPQSPTNVNGTGVSPGNSQRTGSSVLGRLLSRRGSHKAKKGHGEEEDGPDKSREGDKEKSADKERGGRFKMSGGALPAIRSGKRLCID
ncbi:hypothetical protein BU17DRAFT_64045 [Hysterangium stoloniferum]|nr:hypothetical protein BU17DRAFT_64045 [Hysterangium stoloniferum]